MPTKRIGELNGIWAILFRVCLVLIPLAIAGLAMWATHIEKSLHALDLRITSIESYKVNKISDRVMQLEVFKGKGKRWTETDARLQTQVIKAWVYETIDRKVPPRDVLSRLDALELVTHETGVVVQENKVMLARIATKMNLSTRTD